MNGQIDKLFGARVALTDNRGNDSEVDSLRAKEDADEKALLKGLLLGSKEGLSESQVDDFRISNLSHILAVSGMHISYIILAAIFVFSMFNLRKQVIHILTILVIIFFMFLTGFTPSVVRASIMGILVLVAFLFKRKSDVWISISIASLLTLIYNPYILFSLSYQLSYLGTVGIILGMKVVSVYREKQHSLVTEREILEEKVVKRKRNKNARERLIYRLKQNRKIFIDVIIVCISAQVFIFPIILLYFNTFSLYFFISNILVSFVVGIIIILGFVVVLLSYVCFPLVYGLNFIEKWLLSFVGVVAEWVSGLPMAILYFKTPYVISIIIYFVLVVGLVGCVVVKERVIKRKIKKYYRSRFKSVEKVFGSVFDCGFVN